MKRIASETHPFDILAMNGSAALFDKFYAIVRDEQTRRIFERIAGQPGLSGWQLAIEFGVGVDAKQVEEVLARLSKEDIVKSTPPGGLDGNYGLTPLGFSLRELLRRP